MWSLQAGSHSAQAQTRNDDKRLTCMACPFPSGPGWQYSSQVFQQLCFKLVQVCREIMSCSSNQMDSTPERHVQCLFSSKTSEELRRRLAGNKHLVFTFPSGASVHLRGIPGTMVRDSQMGFCLISFHWMALFIQRLHFYAFRVCLVRLPQAPALNRRHQSMNGNLLIQT